MDETHLHDICLWTTIFGHQLYIVVDKYSVIAMVHVNERIWFFLFFSKLFVLHIHRQSLAMTIEH